MYVSCIQIPIVSQGSLPQPYDQDLKILAGDVTS